MYVRVYAPDGEPFDVTRDRADRLILQEGWTQTPPNAVAITEIATDDAEAEAIGEATTLSSYRSRPRTRKQPVTTPDPTSE